MDQHEGEAAVMPMNAEMSEGHWLPHLPEEIWEMILQHLSTLDDMRNAAGSTKVFRRILHPTRHLWLFPKVFPFLTKYLSMKDIFNCRGVSSHWRQGVDEFIQNAEHLAPYSERHPGGHGTNRLPVWRQTEDNFPFQYHGKYRDSMLNMMMDIFLRNGPFIWREMAFKLNPCNYPTLLRIHAALPSYRHHIWYLHMEIPDPINFIAAHSLLKAILRNLPNLRQLYLNARSPTRSYNDGQEEGVSVSIPAFTIPLGLRTLQFEFEHGLSIPVGHSRYIDKRRQIGSMERLPYPLEEGLVRDHSHVLGRLEVTRWHQSWHSLSWPNLTELHVALPAIHSLEGNTLWSLSKLTAPNLGKLVLRFHGGHSRFHWEILQLLQQFQRLRYIGLLFPQLELIPLAPWVEPVERYGCTGNCLERERKCPKKEGCVTFWPNFDEALRKSSASFPFINTLELPEMTCLYLRQYKLHEHFPNLQWLICQNVNGLAENDKWRGESAHDYWLGQSEGTYCCSCNRSFDKCLDELHILSDFWMMFPHLRGINAGGIVRTRSEFQRDAQGGKTMILDDGHLDVFLNLAQMYFPNVTQLKLIFREARSYWSDIDRKFLMRSVLSFPNLDKLELEFNGFNLSASVLGIKPPAVSSASIHQEEFIFPSVKHLKVNQQPICKGFLVRFPNLECLEYYPWIDFRKFRKGWLDPILYESVDPFVDKLESSRDPKVKRVLESEVWNLLPFLKSFRVTGGRGGCDLKYTKDGEVVIKSLKY